MFIRAENNNDQDVVYAINELAFGRPSEALLVNALRDQAKPIVSLVASLDDEIVGHIMFSPVILSGNPDIQIMGLGPMAVTPGHQRMGIGSALVQAGLEQCEQLGYKAVVVLGHPEYYPRFGFTPSSRFGILSEYDVPEEVFMVLELEPQVLSDLSGTVQYHDVFSSI